MHIDDFEAEALLVSIKYNVEVVVHWGTAWGCWVAVAKQDNPKFPTLAIGTGEEKILAVQNLEKQIKTYCHGRYR